MILISKIHKYATVILLMLLLSCNKQNSGNSSADYSSSDKLLINVNINSSKSTSEDTQISTVRFITFNEDGELIYNKITTPQTNAEGEQIYDMLVEKGDNDIHIICNENEELAQKLNTITKATEIDEIKFNPLTSTTSVPMYKHISGNVVTSGGVKITVDGVTASTLSVNIERIIAKLNLSFIKNIADIGSDFVVEQLQVKICRMPKYTTIKPNQPYTGEWLADKEYTLTGTLTNNGRYTTSGDSFLIPTGVDNISLSNIYILEHLLVNPADADEATYIHIDAMVRPNSDKTKLIHTVYRLDLGISPPTNHNIVRNNQYDIFVTLVGQGELAATYIAGKWIPEEVHGDIDAPFLNLSDVRPSLTATMDADGRIVVNQPTDLTFYFWTNRPASTVKFSVDPTDPNFPLEGEPKLTILKDGKSPDGAPDVAGKIDVKVSEQWVKDNYSIYRSTEAKIGTLTADKLSNSMHVQVDQGVFTPEITGVPTTTGRITATLYFINYKYYYTVTEIEFNIVVCLDPATMVLIPNTSTGFGLDDNYFALTLEEVDRRDSDDGTANITYKVKISRGTNDEYFNIAEFNLFDVNLSIVDIKDQSKIINNKLYHFSLKRN